MPTGSRRMSYKRNARARASRASGASRNAKVAAARKTNRPVARALKYRPKYPKAIPVANKRAILTLARQVKSVQMGLIGQKQWQHQFLADTSTGLNAPIRPSQECPFAFCVSNLYNDCPVHYGYMNGTTPTFGTTHKWSSVEAPQDIGAGYLWNRKQSLDTVAPDHFLPIRTFIRFNVKARTGPSVHPIRLRFTVFKLKGIQTNIHTALPAYLGAYRNMVRPDSPEERNHFNTHEFHKVLMDKWVTIQQTDSVRDDVERTVTIPFNFPNKVVAPEILTSEPDPQTFNTNTMLKDQVWLLISSSMTQAETVETPVKCELFAERWNTWRDNAGGGS